VPRPEPASRAATSFVDYLRVEQTGGVVLLVAAGLALVAANSPLSASYDQLRSLTFGLEPLGIRLDLRTWASDGLLAIFFYVAGLEVKRELLIGELADRRAAALPVLAAVGGMVAPALVYLLVAGGTAGAGRGWAVPTATDIAFALGVLAVAGSRAPAGLRVFLLSLAVVDDLGAIALIAVLYTSTLSLLPLAGAAVLCVGYWLAQRARWRSPLLYLPLAVAIWVLVHASGVHATVAGVALGLLTRVRPDDGERHAPADRLEHRLQPWSAGIVVPVFAFTAAGVAVSGTALRAGAADPVALGVVLGLVVGKPVGVLAAAALAVRLRIATLPTGLGRADVAGVAVLAGAGFTVSLLLTDLAFADPDRRQAVTLAVLLASGLASLLGAAAVRARRRAHVGENLAG